LQSQYNVATEEILCLKKEITHQQNQKNLQGNETTPFMSD